MRNYGKVKYKKELADEMTAYFENYSDSLGAPSFEKFARLKGLTVSYLISLRRQKRFDLAYRECSEIRRDYLIDRALCKRFDPTFVKFLLADESTDDETDSTASFTLRVIE